jgi:hypothetical protein
MWVGRADAEREIRASIQRAKDEAAREAEELGGDSPAV